MSYNPNSFLQDPWIDSGAIIIAALGGGFSKGGSVTADSFRYKRIGDSAICRVSFSRGGGAPGSMGSGINLITLPAALTANGGIDTAKCETMNSLYTGPDLGRSKKATIGSGSCSNGGANRLIFSVLAYNATQLTITDETGSIWNSGVGPDISGSDSSFGFDAIIPIAGWS